MEWVSEPAVVSAITAIEVVIVILGNEIVEPFDGLRSMRSTLIARPKVWSEAAFLGTRFCSNSPVSWFRASFQRAYIVS
ncbi:MAG: hypothetical protein EOO83_00565 [Oxalobacteraceae bacterium]|nr:MAG: hypothetical protein EOO83_00565 [Oxalobacteraceae bacterium]